MTILPDANTTTIKQSDLGMSIVDERKSNLGVYHSFLVKSAEGKAKYETAKEIIKYRENVVRDVEKHALNQERDSAIATMTVRDVPLYAALQAEMLTRFGQGIAATGSITHEGLMQALELRHAQENDVGRLAAKGALPSEDVAEAIELVRLSSGENINAILKAGARARACLERHVEAATDHIFKKR